MKRFGFFCMNLFSILVLFVEFALGNFFTCNRKKKRKIHIRYVFINIEENGIFYKCFGDFVGLNLIFLCGHTISKWIFGWTTLGGGKENIEIGNVGGSTRSCCVMNNSKV